jgi:hypothetical protein
VSDPLLAQPRLDDVLAALVKVRQRQGITQEDIDAHPALLDLRCTRAEMARVGLQDPGPAAYQVIRCTVSKAISRCDLRDILYVTLNLGDDYGETLELRRTWLKGKLGLSTNPYFERETTAYRELASVLLTQATTPCDDEADSVPVEVVARLDGRAAEAGGVLVDLLRELVRSLMAEEIEHYRESLANAILDLLPEERAEHYEDSAVEAVARALGECLWLVWDAIDVEDKSSLYAEIVRPDKTYRLRYNAFRHLLSSCSFRQAVRVLTYLEGTIDDDFLDQYFEWAHKAIMDLASWILDPDYRRVVYGGARPAKAIDRPDTGADN